jgi:hypothetical protein
MIGGFKWLFLFSADSISRQLKQKQSLMTDSTWPVAAELPVPKRPSQNVAPLQHYWWRDQSITTGYIPYLLQSHRSPPASGHREPLD